MNYQKLSSSPQQSYSVLTSSSTSSSPLSSSSFSSSSTSPLIKIIPAMSSSNLADKLESATRLTSPPTSPSKTPKLQFTTTEITKAAAIAAIFPPFSPSANLTVSPEQSSPSTSSSCSSSTSCSSLETSLIKSSPSSVDSTCRVIDVKEISNTYRDDLKEWIDQSRARPRLVGFLANKDPSAITYARWTQRSCEEIGIKFELRQVEREDLEEGIIEANEDRRVDGIMVYYPVFGGGHDQYIQNCVSPFKDVEGLCHTFRFNMYHNIRFIDVQKKSIIPCTPLAIVKILDHLGVYNHEFDYGDQLNGKVITVINRSEVVGRPLAALLANDGAKTYSVDLDGILQFHRGPGKQKHRVTSTDKTLKDVLPISDVVIAGVPDKKFKVPTELLKPGVVAVNFSTDRNFPDNVKEKASVFVPAIGKMTIVMLQRNLMRLYDYRRDAPFRFRFS